MRFLWGLVFCGLMIASEEWKKNPFVLQNPDTFLWNFKEKSNIFDLIPFAPPKELQRFPYKMHSYLEPPIEPLIPQVMPNPWQAPPYIFIPDPVYEMDLVISYQFLLKNEVPQGEKYDISKPTHAIDKNKVMDYSCEIDVALNDDEIPSVLEVLIPYVLRLQKEQVLECLYKSGVQVREDSYSNKNYLNNKIVFALPPKWVRVSLQNGFLLIKVFKEKK
ncbi:hypothetical protein [Helicobacter anatolicus]|uniref:hypothetical protein n=1 Tax=Helicobacter anatolicus TaxID=2905874 RepID=UPI001E5BE3FC|nr:hypothetical protein [Helicobacter anatolicus]MCE3039004.1 hypothetical protein [Helicobacter anatolicus]